MRFALLSLALLLCAARAAENPRIYKDRITPHWFENNTRFWYENALPGDKKEIVVIDTATGARERVDKAPTDEKKELQALVETRPSSRDGGETKITFQNNRAQPVELFWIDFGGEQRSYGKLGPNERREIDSFEGHVWLISGGTGEKLAVFEATANPSTAVVVDTFPKTTADPARGRRRGRNREEGPSDRSPDGVWTAFVKDHNLFIKSKDEKEIQLTQDGKDGQGYGRFSWSPDSKTLVAFRIEPGERKEVHLVTSSPAGGGRATLRSRPYGLPGDKFSKYEVNVFDIASQKQIKPEVDRFEHEYETPRVRWRRDGTHFAYHQDDRGHQRFRVIEVNVSNGAVRNVVDERSDTFIWTTHIENLNLSLVNWFEQSDALIYVSEQSGWRHLYYIDATSGKSTPITQGDWVIRGLDTIDETNKVIWFRASGVFPDQDPYLIHFGRVNFDGSGLTWLTEGNGNHSVQFSPDRKFIIDTYSRVDAAPVNELRRVSDGKLICKFEEADISELASSGWESPEVFVSKARDGKTDIWGIICRPRDLDPNKKYPILEDIYAGPQGSFVPKIFSAQNRYQSWNKLGFIVVKIDGMGTANRSKAFHDVCFQNLKDAGFEDRILWMKAAAQKYPYLDLSRVGIYGTSAGGQNAAAAVLFHPEFYKAAMANCGCHDNRMDKASWNEQWMGYPVGPHYSECSNIDNASKLKGALFLVVGELDTNVPPESTMRFADALIKAGKDFDLLVVPGADHGTRGAASGYVQRRVQDFFVRHLMGAQIPNRNAEPSS